MNIIIGIIILGILLIYLDNRLLTVSKYRIHSYKIPKEFNGLKIVQLSDFHSHTFLGSGNYRVVEKINKEQPDIIVMTGDMVNKYDKKFNKFLELAEELSKSYKIYYIQGNHEQRLKKHDLGLILNRLDKLGIKVLKDEKTKLERSGGAINIYGIDIPLQFYKVINKPANIEKIIYEKLKNYNKEEYNILLAHNPLYFELYSKYNVDLILSGHVHGGMVRIPFAGGLLSPERKFFPKYDGGLYEIDNKSLIVSRGLGHSKPLFRVFNMPEILSITLISADQI